MPIISNFPGSGKDGAPGKSAFQSAQENGYTGSEAEFYAALVALKDGPFLPKPTGTAGQVLGFTADNTVGAVDRSSVIVNLTGEQTGSPRLDKTYAEIVEIVEAGRDVLIKPETNFPLHFGFLDKARRTLFFWSDIEIPRAADRSGVSGQMMMVFDNNTIEYFANKLHARNIACTPIGEFDEPVFSALDVYSALIELNDKIPSPVKATRITLTTAGWNASAKTQTVTVSGVLADETKQLIMPMPAVASQNAYAAAGIACTAQAANSLTFKCQTVPTENITVYVAVQGVA